MGHLVNKTENILAEFERCEIFHSSLIVVHPYIIAHAPPTDESYRLLRSFKDIETALEQMTVKQFIVFSSTRPLVIGDTSWIS